MFGFKIISNEKYRKCLEKIDALGRELNESNVKSKLFEHEAKYLRRTKDENEKKIANLNQQCREYEKSITKLKSQLGTGIGKYFDVIIGNEKCDLCKRETKDCIKYVFGEETVCLIPKVPFRKEGKKPATKKSKSNK